MKSNGFGSVEQIVTVQKPSGEVVTFTRWTTKPDDDETLVYELTNRFGLDFNLVG